MSYALGLFSGLFISVIIGLLITLYNEIEIKRRNKKIKSAILELREILEEEVETL